MAKLLGYDYVIEYKAGAANAAADALSRKGESYELGAFSGPEWMDMQEVLQELEVDEYVKKCCEGIARAAREPSGV